MQEGGEGFEIGSGLRLQRDHLAQDQSPQWTVDESLDRVARRIDVKQCRGAAGERLFCSQCCCHGNSVVTKGSSSFDHRFQPLIERAFQSIGRALPCVHVPDPDADYEYALTAIPGQLIRDLYLRYGTTLLEANIRTFLGNKRAVNKGIVETLRKEPEHFLAFNNGLVLVCDEAAFERTDDGNLGLSFLKGLQIVNGGQTTSTIYFSSRDDRTIDLSHVMVPAKIIILKGSQDEARERLISNVSRYANSQNAVKMSDLSANRPFHRELEKLANETWCPDGATRWFYERAAGAYNVMLLREGTTPAKRRNLKEMIPPKRKLTKNDIAKYHEAWRGKPNQVAMAGEKNFAAFMAALDDDPTIVPSPLNVRWYRAMIAKVILFKAIESMIKTKEAKETFRQGWINIATYVVSIVADRLGDRLDLEQIWMRQGISGGLRDLLGRGVIDEQTHESARMNRNDEDEI